MMVEVTEMARNATSTVSQLFIDTKFCCFVIEDAVRQEKIPGSTAIPSGTYRLVRDYTSKYVYNYGYCWWIVNVPGFEEIKIHKGNTIKDTRGCLLPNTLIGFDGKNWFGRDSRTAYEEMMSRLSKQHEHTIRIYRNYLSM